MKKIISFFLAVILSLAAFSQPSQNSDFSKVCALISQNKVTKGNFTQTKSIKKISREIKSSGRFIVSIQDGILWNTLKPFNSSMAISKNGIVQTTASGKKSLLAGGNNGTFEQVSSIMTSLFNGNEEEMDKNFQIEFSGNTEGWSLDLTPRDSSVRAFIDKIHMTGKRSIDSMIISEASGDYTKYEFSEQKFADSLTDEEKTVFIAQ